MAAPMIETRPVATVLETPALAVCSAGWLEVAEEEDELCDELLDAAAEVALALTLLITELKVEAVEVDEELELLTTAALPWA